MPIQRRGAAPRGDGPLVGIAVQLGGERPSTNTALHATPQRGAHAPRTDGNINGYNSEFPEPLGGAHRVKAERTGGGERGRLAKSWLLRNILWARHQRTGSPTRKAVLQALATYADKDGRCFPSHARLAQDTELAEITVWREMQQLEAQGLIARRRRHDKYGRRTSDEIVLLIDDPNLP